MQITFHIPEFVRKERNLHCDVVYITTEWVSRLVLDHAIAAIQRPIIYCMLLFPCYNNILFIHRYALQIH